MDEAIGFTRTLNAIAMESVLDFLMTYVPYRVASDTLGNRLQFTMKCKVIGNTTQSRLAADVLCKYQIYKICLRVHLGISESWKSIKI